MDGSALGGPDLAIFVLVHGAFHGGWCWERVAPMLEARGHRVLAPDLPGMGEDKTPHDELTPETWTGFLVEMLRGLPEPVVLVGHSRGGMQISSVAEAAPELVRRLVYLSAFVPRDGQDNLTLAMELCSAELLQGSAQAAGDKPGANREFIRSVFYNTTEDQWVDRAASLLTPEPMTGAMEPANLSAERFGSVGKTYIECLEDKAIPIAGQRTMQSHAVFDQVLQLPTDHSPFYSAPELLAEALCEAVAGPD
jgi:pimeloyl-ACP methyl ester carboxylesterase